MVQDSRARDVRSAGFLVLKRILVFPIHQGDALDRLFTQVIASLVDQQVVPVSRVSQDGVRVRVSAGASSFRREERLQELLAKAKEHVAELRRQVDSPEGSSKGILSTASTLRVVIPTEDVSPSGGTCFFCP